MAEPRSDASAALAEGRSETDPSALYRAPGVAQAMSDAARRFLDSLTAEQRGLAWFPFTGDERYAWNYRPTPRHGLRLINMTREQQGLALGLVDTGVSLRAQGQVRWIMELEVVLREVERAEKLVFPGVRDVELYWFSVFGEPGGTAPWAWRVGGHHIGLHFTVVDRDMVAPTPCFLGANPARVPLGVHEGRRALPKEEDLPRALVVSLSTSDRALAVTRPVAPADILTDAYRSLDRFVLPRGLAFGAMTGEHRARLVDIIKLYVGRVADDLGAHELARIEAAGLESVTFAWEGPTEPGFGHYYAIQGPTFVIEYDNTQNNANHIHSVWRSFNGDWGEDLLALHYARSHVHIPRGG